MKTQSESFDHLFKPFEHRYDLRSVFDDFLLMIMCSVTQNLKTGKSYYEDLYLQTIGKYKEDTLRAQFPKLFAQLVLEMDARVASDSGNDVLGEYYEQNLARKGAQQFFTPWPICSFMAKMVVSGDKAAEKNRPLRILEPTCGSGRMLLACAKEIGPQHEFYGIDIDNTCIKMSAINLFLNGLFHSEVLCGDALSPEDFVVSYRTSLLPLGIFTITEKEKSMLWHMKKASFQSQIGKKENEPPPFLSSEMRKTNESNGEQMIMF